MKLAPNRAHQVAREPDADDAIVAGKTLLDVEADDYTDPSTLVQARRLMRHLLHHHLSGQPLHTRSLAFELRALEQTAGRPVR